MAHSKQRLRELGVPDDPQLFAVRVEVVHEMRCNFDVTLVEVVLPAFRRRRIHDLRTDAVRVYLVGLCLVADERGLAALLQLLFSELYRVAIEGRVREQARGLSRCSR